MNNMQVLEKRLAELLGWADVAEANFYGIFRLQGTKSDLRTNLPRWTADNGAAFGLMCQYGVDVVFYPEQGAVNSFIEGNPQGALCEFSEFETREQAVRCSIVSSVIMKLEAAQ